MNWNVEKEEINWNAPIKNIEAKQVIADKIAAKVKDGDVIGFGSGSTSFVAAKAIAKRVKEENLKITAIPTSVELKMLCNDLGIETTTLMSQKPDWSFDGADEVDKDSSLIKGRGAAMFKEKLNIANSDITYILVDNSKMVDYLGQNFPIPIEIFPESIEYVKLELKKLGATKIELRKAVKKDGPVITENSNLILDTNFQTISMSLEKDIKSIIGVIESGLFIGYNVEIIGE